MCAGGSKLAEKLIDIYFAMFALLMHQTAEAPDADQPQGSAAAADKKGKKARHRDREGSGKGKPGKGGKAGKAGEQQPAAKPSQVRPSPGLPALSSGRTGLQPMAT